MLSACEHAGLSMPNLVLPLNMALALWICKRAFLMLS